MTTCTSYTLNATDSIVIYNGSANRPTGAQRFTGVLGYDTATDTLEMWDGAAWQTVARPWAGNPIAYTPQLYTNNTLATLGTGATAEGVWFQRGKLRTVIGRIVIGTAPTISAGANLEVTLPVNATGSGILAVGTGVAVDGGAVFYACGAFIDRTAQPGRARFAYNNTVLSSTGPFTWAATDTITWQVQYATA